VVVWTLVTCSVATAQSRWSGYATLGLFGGIYGDDQEEIGFTASVSAFSRINRVIGLGPSFAYHKIGDGSLDADLSLRIRKPAGRIRPYATIGAGLSMRHVFSGTHSHLGPLIVLGIGAYFPNVIGTLGVGIHGGCRGIFHEIDGGFFGDLNLTISLGIYLN
jgi:hypothetical protein